MAGEKVGAIYYTVEAETAKLLSDIDNARNSLDKLQSTLGKTDKAASGTQFQMTKTASAVQELGRQAQAAQNPLSSLNRLLGGLLTLRGAQSISAMADAYTNLQNRLRLVTDGQQQLATATNDVFRIANSTSQAVDSIGQVYQRFAQNAKGLGLDLKQVAAVTETVAKAVAISGASSASAQAALTQFGQALASGTLRGEELNSVMEQTPGLAAAIAKGLGITIGELRAIAAEGQITSQKLIAALNKAAEDVDKQFATSVKTVSQAVTELQNSMMRFVGEASTASGASANIANAISLLSQNLEALSSILLAVGAGALAKYIAQMGAKAIASAQAAVAARDQAVQEAALATQQAKTASAALMSAKADMERARSAVAAAEAKVAADRREQASNLERLRNMQQMLVAEKAIETQRLSAQINDIGRQKTATRMAELQLAVAAADKQVEIAEKSLAATTTAASAQIQAAYAARTVAADNYAKASAAASATSIAADKAAVASKIGISSATSGLMALLGGPIGLISLAASVAAGMYLMSDGVDKAKVNISDLGISLESTKAKMAEMVESQRRMAVEAAKIELADSVKKLDVAFKDLVDGSLADGTKAVAKWRAANSDALQDLFNKAVKGEISYRALDAKLLEMIDTYAKANGKSAEWTRQMQQEVSVVTEAARAHEDGAQKVGIMTQALDSLANAADGASGSMSGLSDRMAGWNGKPGEMLQKLVDELFTIEEAGSRVKQIQRQIAQQRMSGGEVGADMEKRLLDAAQRVDAAAKARDAARKKGSHHAGREESAMAYYYGLVAANETALAKIDAEEKKALEENAKRRAVDKKNADVYENARVEIVKKYAREREKFEEQNTQEIAAFNIQMMTDQEAKIAAIRDEAIRRADASVKLGTASAEQAERAKALAVETYSRESAKLQEQVMQAASDNKIAATQSEAEKIILIYAEAVRRADAQYRAGAISFAMSEQNKVRAATDAANAMRNLQAQYDPLANEQQRFAQQIDSLKRLNEAKLLEDQRYRDLTAGAERTHQQQMLALHEQVFAAQSIGNQLLISSLNQVQQVGTSVMTGLLTGATNGTDAMRALAGAVLNEVVGSFVQMGIAQVKAWLMGEAAQATAGAAYVASVAGQVEATTALAAQAAFASTAAIPVVGPALAPEAAVAAGLAAQALGAPAVLAATTAMAGGRQYGGPVAPGKMYRINETGAPEVLNMAGGKQYMLPNARGEVVSNRDATSGGGGGGSLKLTVNLIGAPEGTSVEQRQISDKEYILDVMMEDVARGGRFSSFNQSTFGLRRQGR